MNKIVAVIPVREGSERIPGKNFIKFADTTLIENKIRILKSLDEIDKIIINSDSLEAEKIARNHGIEFIKREKLYASSTTPNNVFWKQLGFMTEAENILIAQVTSPLISRETYKRFINEFFTNIESIDSINSVTLEKKYLWLNDKSLNYNPDKTPKSQDLPNIYSLNFGITIIKRNVLIGESNVVAKRHKFLEIDPYESIDIDYPIDFKLAEILYFESKINKEDGVKLN
jgi:CMP-N-acetylneuraminic acid synthetase